jgi:hypothetical protein
MGSGVRRNMNLAPREGRKQGDLVLLSQGLIPGPEFIIDGNFHGIDFKGKSTGHT